MTQKTKIMTLCAFLALCGSAWAFDVTDPNLIAHWTFDEGSGTTAYDSAGTNNGTIYGPTWTTGQINGALSFDGANDYVDVGNNSSLKPPLPVTLSAWIKLSNVGTPKHIITLDSQRPRYCGIWFAVTPQNTLEISYGDGYGGGASSYRRTKVGTTALNAGIWYHVVAVVRGATNMSLYVNAVDNGGIYTGSGGSLAYSSANARIGIVHDLTSDFNGIIDDVRVYNRALSAEEVLQLYLGRTPVACIAGGDQIVEADNNCEARVVLDGSCSSDEDSTQGTNDDINDFNWYEIIDPCDPNSDILLGSGEIIECNLPLGEHTILLEVTDTAGSSDSNAITVTVEDITPPAFTLSVGPNVLWPPNNKMVQVTPTWIVSDNCDEEVDVSLVDITIEDTGNTEGDILVGPDDGSIRLRAERSGTGKGRIYTITCKAVDDSGNVAVDSATVTVPHAMK